MVSYLLVHIFCKKWSSIFYFLFTYIRILVLVDYIQIEPSQFGSVVAHPVLKMEVTGSSPGHTQKCKATKNQHNIIRQTNKHVKQRSIFKKVCYLCNLPEP
jgi:hypothetical protein